VNEGTLTEHIAFGQPAHLSFADHVHRLVPVNRVQRALNRTKTETRGNALLDEAVILLDHVVQIRTPPISAPAAEFPLAFQLGEGVHVCLVASDVDDAWTNLGAAA